MAKRDHPMTNAIRHLTKAGVSFEVIPYTYELRGGTRSSSRQLGVEEHTMVKTLIMETAAGTPLVVLMHGDREVSTKNMARALGVKSVKPCEPKTADRYSGYFVGGTSPFGTRRAMDVYVEATIFQLPQIHINAGHRGLMLRMDPADLRTALDITEVNVAV